MCRGASVEMLAPEQIRAAYPLLRQAVPGLTLGAWLRMAPRLSQSQAARRDGENVDRPAPGTAFSMRPILLSEE